MEAMCEQSQEWQRTAAFCRSRIPERENSRESTKDLRWKQAWSVQTTERMPKWLEHSEQEESERRCVEKAKCTLQPRLSIIKGKDNSGPKYSQMIHYTIS